VQGALVPVLGERKARGRAGGRAVRERRAGVAGDHGPRGARGAQCLVATHSPALLACPGARVYELDADGITERDYDDLEAVRLTRAFLDAPDRFLRAAPDELSED
jgi:hypothetical protein